MKIKIMKISELISNPKNPRVIKDAEFKKLVKSIKESPWMLEIRPVVVDGAGVVIGGNQRLKAAQAAGLIEVPVVDASSLTEAQRKEFIIKDNVSAGDWDIESLASDWDAQDLEDWGLDFDIPDPEQVEAQEDDFQARDDVETDIVLGDVIEIGRHRLVCGDSTSPTTVSALLGQEEPFLMVTDPPYGVEYDPAWRNVMGVGARSLGVVENDGLCDWSEAWSLSPARVVYVYHAAKYAAEVCISLQKNDFEIRNQIIWAKNHFAISRGDYHWKHEPCWYAVKKGAKSNWIGGRDKTTVWGIDKNSKNETGHSTQKPVECMARCIENHTGDVYDPFLGSGTTMVAAHQLGRRCFGVELSPKYCQVVVNRMMKLDPQLTVKINGIEQRKNRGLENE